MFFSPTNFLGTHLVQHVRKSSRRGCGFACPQLCEINTGLAGIKKGEASSLPELWKHNIQKSAQIISEHW